MLNTHSLYLKTASVSIGVADCHSKVTKSYVESSSGSVHIRLFCGKKQTGNSCSRCQKEMTLIINNKKKNDHLFAYGKWQLMAVESHKYLDCGLNCV